MRELLKRRLAQARGNRLVRDAVHAVVIRDLDTLRFERVGRWPASVDGFEDLAFLFSSNQLNHGIASLQLDEAAHLFRTVRSAGAGTVVEIGRFRGGGTFLLASALADGGRLVSYDLDDRYGLPGPELDRELTAALERYGLLGRVQLVVGDSRTADPPERACDVVFIDGDHSYEGARADYLRWRELVRPGGHLLFHDAADTGGYGTVHEDVVRLVGEIEREDSTLERVEGAGSLAHFVRR